MKTYVISLKERADRREKFSMPFEYEFLIQERLTKVLGISWSLANLGCMLGHRQAIQLAKDQGLDAVLVLEDDAELVGEIPSGMPEPVTFLGGDTHGTHIIGSHAVCYQRSSFDPLLNALPTLEQLQAAKHPPMFEPYDAWLSRGAGYVDVFKSFDEDGGDIPHGGKYQNSTNSASVIIPIIASLFNFKSVVDWGCHKGSWLKTFKQHGATRVHGYDTENIDQLAKGEFTQVDFEQHIPHRKCDLAVCLETAEHISEERSGALVDSLTESADTVLFSAAIPNQGGHHHVNEQPHSYWHKKFLAKGFTLHDILRPKIKDNPKVAPWYRNNTFTYLKH
jgi:hypothetical protein